MGKYAYRVDIPNKGGYIVQSDDELTPEQAYTHVNRQLLNQEYAYQASPTRGQPEWWKFAAGAGRALTDLGRGLSQRMGRMSEQEVEEARRQDAPLMREPGANV